MILDYYKSKDYLNKYLTADGVSGAPTKWAKASEGGAD